MFFDKVDITSYDCWDLANNNFCFMETASLKNFVRCYKFEEKKTLVIKSYLARIC